MDDIGEPKAFRVLCVRISTQASHSNICRDSLLIPPEFCASAMDSCSFGVVAPTLATAATVKVPPPLAPLYYLVPVVVLAHAPVVVRAPLPVGRMERPPLPPTSKTRAEDRDDDEMLVRITKTLVNLLDGDEVQSPFRRRLRNAKISRSTVIWKRLVKKLLLLLRNKHAPACDLLSEHKPYL